MANDWQIVIGGKPFSSIPPYTIIAFELTILFGGLLTALGLFVQGKLLRFKKHEVYHPRFSAEDFGVVVTLPTAGRPRARVAAAGARRDGGHSCRVVNSFRHARTFFLPSRCCWRAPSAAGSSGPTAGSRR